MQREDYYNRGGKTGWYQLLHNSPLKNTSYNTPIPPQLDLTTGLGGTLDRSKGRCRQPEYTPRQNIYPVTN